MLLELSLEDGTMKILDILPRENTRLYGALVKKQADIRKKGMGTFSRVGRKKRDAAKWKHLRYKGTILIERALSETVTAEISSPTPEDERRMLSSFLGFVDRHCGDQIMAITIKYRS